MQGNINLGKVFGIPIGLNASWFVIFGLLTWSLAVEYFPARYPELTGPLYLVLGAVTSILFAASVLAHELGHAYLAIRNRIPVKSIVLFIFGGVAQLGAEPRSPGAEFRIAIAGPLVSLAAAGFFGVLWIFDRQFPWLAAPSEYLLRINLILAVFNLIPGFPLDGGRVLRAVVWKITNSYVKATRIASGSGQLVAFGFIGIGVYNVITGNVFNGLWLAFIGWFLQNAASSAQAQVTVQQALQGVKVSQVMSKECVQAPGLAPISQLVEEQVLQEGRFCFYVADSGRLDGMLTLQDIRRVPQPKWRFTTLRQAMIPATRIQRLTPDTDLITALQLLEESQQDQVAVIEDDFLVGVLSREHILRFLRTRAELGLGT